MVRKAPERAWIFIMPKVLSVNFIDPTKGARGMAQRGRGV
jgi:hypothetical protein